MEEEKEVKKQKEAKEIKITTSLIYMIFALVSLGCFIIAKICFHFGAVAPVFYGIMAIFIYCLPFVGMILSYLGSKKLGPEFWANLGALGIALAFYII